MIRMATDIGQAYRGWSCEFPDRNDSQDVSISQMLDHGSISFGRFAVESLSWEKRSVFTYNKCQEELEKFKAPGLVAQKKAFFEEHYRKLRAQKALQENQQTELTLDYGGDGSISSQTGEEDEPSLQHESLGDGEANVTDDLSEDKNVTIEEKMNCNEALEIRSLDSELLNVDSSRRSIEKVDQEKKSNNALELLHSDTEFMGQRLSTKNIDVEQNDLSDVENKNISKIEEGAASNIGPEVTYQGSAIGSKIARVGDSKLRPAKNIIQDKTRQTIKKSREACMSVPKPKEAIPSVRDDLKLDARMMLDLLKLPNGGKALQKSSGKAESSTTLCKPTSNRVSGSNISATSASNRPLTECKPTTNRVAKNKISAFNASDKQLAQVRPNVTIPRPFSFATERRAAAPAGIRETTQKESKASSRLEHSLVSAKSGVQVNLKKTTITSSSANGRGLKNRVHEELRKRPLEMESKCTGPRGSSAHVAHMLGTRKSRSIDLPPQNKSYPNDGIEKQLATNIKGDKGKEGKGDARLKEPQCVRTKARTIPMDRNVHTGNAKTIEPAFSMRRPRTADLLLDGRKCRGEMPRWR